MRTIASIFLAAALLGAALSACTPAQTGSAGFVPAVRQSHPLDSGGGLPPHPAPTR